MWGVLGASRRRAGAMSSLVSMRGLGLVEKRIAVDGGTGDGSGKGTGSWTRSRWPVASCSILASGNRISPICIETPLYNEESQMEGT